MLSPMLAGVMKSRSPDGVRIMTREEYDAVDALNWSSLKHLLQSPAHYRHAKLNPGKDTDAKKLGRCTHLATLEPEKFAQACVLWDGGTRRGKEWDAFKTKHAGREILKEEELAHCVAVAAAVRADATAARYLAGGQAEASLLWLDRRLGLECKARVDFVASCGALVDLKTTRDASQEGFGREVWRYHYHTQAAWYSDGYFAATGKRLPYFLVAVETEAPHVVQVYRVRELELELGRAEYQGLLDTLVTCRASNSWGGYGQGEQLLSLPRWAAPLDELEEMGLVMPGAAAEGGT
jgi:hypothetical protein